MVASYFIERARKVMTTLRMWSVIAAVLLSLCATAAKASILYVDAGATGANNGTSWQNAYRYLQDALAAAGSSSRPVEIRVAHGIYGPDQSRAIPEGSGDRAATFRLANRVTLRGGYAGWGEPDPDARDIAAHESILSGDLNADDGPDFSKNEENSFHVITASQTSQTAILDGFTVRAGNANSTSPDDCGGGMYNEGGSPTIEACRFTGNRADLAGGGMYNRDGNPVFTNCTFSRNASGTRGGGLCNMAGESIILEGCTFADNTSSFGGGIYNLYSSDMRLLSCAFVGNSAVTCGGGMFNSRSSPTVRMSILKSNSAAYGGGVYNSAGSAIFVNCAFDRNLAVGTNGHGGAMDNQNDATPTLVNCLFGANRASGDGGGIRLHGSSSALISNCTFVGNCAASGNTLACDSYQPSPSNVQVMDSILFSGRNQISNNDRSTINVIYSNIQGRWPGPGNIDTDPCFASPPYWADKNDISLIVQPTHPNAVWVSGDCHLKSQAGRWDPISQEWLQDDVDSPCIDAGNPCDYVGDEPNPNGYRINMGAYGGTEQASRSHKPCFWVGMTDACGHTVTQAEYDRWLGLGAPPCWCHGCHCRGDSNCDCTINAGDAQALHDAWPGLGGTYDPCVDTNCDGIINSADVQALRDAWLDLDRGCSGVPGCP